MYKPDFWCVIKIAGDDPHYRVFASWAGGYLYGSSWRMNSGIIMANEDEDCLLFYGSSGSIYSCHKNSYGCHYGSQGDLNQYLSDDRIEMMPEDTDWLDFDWIINE